MTPLISENHSKVNGLFPSNPEPRGSIQPQQLTELWFHTGTICNLSCPFCLEGSKPGDRRLNAIVLEDIRPVMQEALTLGVKKFSFTGGEPFVIPEIFKILDYALKLKPCLVLTNATDPLIMRFQNLVKLKGSPHLLSLRVSLDFPDPAKHDAGRGAGQFMKSLRVLAQLYQEGFQISIARQKQHRKEDIQAANRDYLPYLRQVGLPENIHFTVFPEFYMPGVMIDVPTITEDCMARYQTAESRSRFMCSYSKMVIKKEGRMRVYACTLVDDDPEYDLGESLSESMKARILLKHHRCYSCFAYGTTCSEN